MDKGDTPPLMIPLLALLAIIFPLSMSFRTSGSSSEKTPEVRQPALEPPSTEPEKTTAKFPRHSAAELVHDYLLPRSEDRREWPQSDPRNDYFLDFVIATVPDPADSRLAYYFDAAIDSIQRALEASGYLLDRFDLPWPETGEAGIGSGTKTAPRRYRRDPGILLFRNQGEHKLLLVFLVGETPTRGLQKSAMSAALDQMSEFFPAGLEDCKLPKELCGLTEPKQKDSPLTIKIMGPTFSGSAVSLDFAIRDWRSSGHGRLAESGTAIRIVSGSATAIDPEKPFSLASFSAVVPPDWLTMKEILAYIRSLGYPRVAMLTEASTSYGRQLDQDKLKPDRSSHPDAAQPMILNLPFPLHISQLRTAAEKQRLSQPKSTSGAINNPSPSIPLEEGESSQPKETPPSFSPLEAPSAELVLSNLLSTVSGEGIHAVGILATDVRDTIYLVRELRQHCPGTLIFTVNADLLYEHEDVNASTRGMLVFTPYPLFNSDQVWTPPYLGRPPSERSASRLQFSSQHAEGVYNAMLALLDQQEEMLDYGKPFQPQGSHTSAQPALWVTVVGQNGPLPVKLLDWTRWNSSQDHPNYANYALTFQRQGQKQPTIDEAGIYTSWSVIGMMLLSCVVIAISLLIIRQYHSPGRAVNRNGPDLAYCLLGEPVTPAYQSSSRLFLLACLACLLSAFMVLTVSYSLPLAAACQVGSDPSHPLWLAGLLLAETFMLAGWLLLAFAIAIVLRAFWKNQSANTALSSAVKWVVLVGCGGVLGLALLLCVVWLGWKQPSEQIATFLRGFEYFSGVSPLVPLFCLAFAGVLWGFGSSRRLRMIDGIRPTSRGTMKGECLFSVDTPSFMGVRSLERSVRERLERASAFSTGWYIGISIIGLFAAGYLFFFPFVPSHEGRVFYFLFGLGFFLVYFALAGELGRLCLVWTSFRRLLQRLALHPTRSAYGRYRRSFMGFPRVDLAMPLQTFAVLSFSIDQAERLLRLGSSLLSSTSLPETDRCNLENWISDARPVIQTASRNLSQSLEWKASGNWRFAIKRRTLSQKALGRLAQVTAEFLEPSWRADSLVPSFTPVSPELKQFQKLGEECLVGRTVLLISYVLPSLRDIGAFIISGLLLMLGSVMFYPFVQSNHFLAFNWIVILGFIGLTLLVTLQMERDVLLGLLNESSKPGQVSVTRHLTFRVLTYVMIPILVLLSAQFPDTVGRIVSWFSAAQGQ